MSTEGARTMAGEGHGAVVRGIGRIFGEGSLTGLSEGQLLRRFAAGDDAAFEALVSRHGPAVLGVCRRLLEDPRDAEDAFQATFLVLLKKAGGLRDPEALGPWLYGVACRVASRIRARTARRPVEERKGARPEAVPPDREPELHELQATIDEEILRLPEKYRRPVVLCYVEGRTHEEAARRLRCSTGSLRGRLDRAREKLRGRLIRRGVAPAAAATALAGGEAASAAVPASLVAATVATLGRSATASAVAGAASSPAFEIADGVFRSMAAARLRMAASFALAGAIILAAGAAWLVVLGGSFARDGRDGPAPVGASPDPEGEERGTSIEIRVVDQRSGKLLPGVALAMEFDQQAGPRATTDDAGRAVLTIPAPTPKNLAVAARKEGYATSTLWFLTPMLGEDVIGEGIPASYTLKMYPTETLGGLVTDEQGRPIAGVRVAPRFYPGASTGGRSVQDRIESPPPVSTDDRGRWQCPGMPAGIDRDQVAIAFAHPDYQRVDLPNGRALEDVRGGKAIVLPRGLEVAGRVTDPAGRPIRGARLVLGVEIRGPDVPRAETDADGRFRFAHAPAGATLLTVQAAGFAPGLEEVAVRPGLAPREFRLEKGRAVRGRVVDTRGEPLAGATVTAFDWRGQATLDWRVTTDADGEFGWSDAPPDAFAINVSHEGYLLIYRREVPPAVGELTITLVRELNVRGTVVDARTRHAIPSFELIPGDERGAGAPTAWNLKRAQQGRRGRYEIRFNDYTTYRPEGRRLRVEAKGYRPSVSRVIRDDEDHPVVNFVLEPGAEIAGVVRAPDGSPMAGADVLLVTPSGFTTITDGRPPSGRDSRAVKTGGDGQFAFPGQEPPYTIVALHDRGFAHRTVIEAGSPPAAELTVRPWGRIEGTLRIGGRPGADQRMILAYAMPIDPYGSIPMWDGRARTDASGRFVFERVMPGTVTVSRVVSIREGADGSTTTGTNQTAVDVAPGATARVTIGGKGRPVVGKVKAPAGHAGPIDWTWSLNRLVPKPTPARGFFAFLGGRKPGPVGVTYAVKLEADGSFRIEDVEAGTYELVIQISAPPRDPARPSFGNNPMATANRAVVVPEMPGGRSDEPLDLGTITVEVAKQPEAAPGGRKN